MSKKPDPQPPIVHQPIVQPPIVQPMIDELKGMQKPKEDPQASPERAGPSAAAQRGPCRGRTR